MLPSDANTPVRRIYFNVMMMCLDEADQEQYVTDFTMRVTEFMEAITSPDALAKCVSIVVVVPRPAITPH